LGLGVVLTGRFDIRAFLLHIMAHGEGGQIVTNSSIIGLVTADANGIYATSQSAAVGLMEALRSELSQSDIGASVLPRLREVKYVGCNAQPSRANQSSYRKAVESTSEGTAPQFH
jgi:short-subunit dehydrogenase